MKFLFLILMVFSSNLVFGQERGEHLEPVGGVFTISRPGFEYHAKVRETLFKDFSYPFEIRFLILPSMGYPEKVLSIDYDKETEKYHLKYHIAEQSILLNEECGEIEVIKHIREIEKESVELIKSLFRLAMSKTKYPTSNARGFDGANYYFIVNDDTPKIGMVWSPPENSKMSRLVEISMHLMEITKENESIFSLDGKLREEITQLREDIK